MIVTGAPNTSANEELAATAEEMTSQAEKLQELMSFFKIAGDDASFIIEPKAKKGG